MENIMFFKYLINSFFFTIVSVSSSVNSEKRSSNQSIGTKERIFTYSDILKMTNNFERVLGKGGYGRVYYGNLNDTQVAVKMLFHTSAAQDYKHFKAEVTLNEKLSHHSPAI